MNSSLFLTPQFIVFLNVNKILIKKFSGKSGIVFMFADLFNICWQEEASYSHMLLKKKNVTGV